MSELFERSNGGTRPTVAGREFLISAAQILAETDLAFRKLQTRSRGENGRLSIGIYASLSTGNMYATLVEHHRRFPEVDVHTVDGDHCQLMCALGNNAVDIAIMTSTRSAWADRALALWSERVIAAVHEGHPLADEAVYLLVRSTSRNDHHPHFTDRVRNLSDCLGPNWTVAGPNASCTRNLASIAFSVW